MDEDEDYYALDHEKIHKSASTLLSPSRSGLVSFPSLAEMPSSDVAEIEEQSETYTPNEAIERLGFGRYQLLLFFLTGTLWIADAMETMLLVFLSYGAQCEWQLCPSQKALLSLLVFFGMLIGAPIWGYLADLVNVGRKRVFLLTTAFTLLFGLLSAISPYYPVLLITRFLVGFGIGGGHVAFNLCAEWLPNKWRGKMLVFFALFWTAGSIFEILLAWLFLPVYGWRWLLVFSSLPLLIMLIIAPFLSESPHFLYIQQRYDDLHTAFERVSSWNGVALPGKQLEIPLDPHNDNDESKIPLVKQLALLASSEFRGRTLLLALIWFVDAASYYGCFLLVTELFRIRYNIQDGTVDSCSCQPPWSASEYLTVLWAAISEAPGIFVAAYLIERIGRTWTQTSLLLVTALMAFCLVFPSGQSSEAVFFFVFRAAITSAYQATYACTPELYPTSVRSTILGILACVSRIGAMVAPLISQVLVHASPSLAVFLYALLTLCASTASGFLPETRGKSMII